MREIGYIINDLMVTKSILDGIKNDKEMSNIQKCYHFESVFKKQKKFLRELKRTLLIENDEFLGKEYYFVIVKNIFG